MSHDYIIVGGGSAGCVLAHRLSAQSKNKVLVLEAGQDTPHGKVPPEVLDSYPGTAYFDTRFHWSALRVHLQPISHNEPGERPPLRRYEQGRIMGGGSSINGQLANRGAPNDFDDWERAGAAGWGWDKVLPYFRKLERDMDFDGPYHGNEGQIMIRRLFPELWPGYSKAAAEAFAAAGYDYLPDQNGEFRDGYFPLTISNAFDRRVSAAIGYLGPTVRQRLNLEVRDRTQVERLLVEDGRVTGVIAHRDGQREILRAREVISCSGGIHSPALLLRSGIGPEGHLREVGVEVKHHLSGVGQNLMEHPAVGISAFVRPDARLRPNKGRHMHVALRYSSGLEDCPQGDLFMVAVAKSAWHAVGWRLGSFLTWVNKSYSTGQIKLNGADWRQEPTVEFNMLSDQRDLARLKICARKAAGFMMTPEMQAVIADPFPSSYSERVRNVGTVTNRNKLITGALGALMDGPAWIRRTLIDSAIAEGPNLEAILKDDDALEDFVKGAVTGTWHATCACRMGAPDDPMAVVDPKGRVRGLAGLRVVDSSIMPSVPCANTNIPTIMTAEKMADHILEG